MEYNKLPKVELHLHLDCSLSYEVVQQIRPGISMEEFKDTYIAPPKCEDLVDYIRVADKSLELLQNKENISLATKDLFRRLKEDNVTYAEIRFAPLIHMDNGLTSREVVQCVVDAAQEASKASGIQMGLLLCTLRHFTEEQSMETIKLVEEFRNEGVVGFDIAADEAGFSIKNHIKAFEYAKQHNIPCTAHAGEAKGPESVWETLKYFQPQRIGHGVRSAEDKDLMKHLKELNIHLEVCPTSNVQTAVYDKLEDHKANEIYKSGISMGINTDSRTVSPVTLYNEYNVMDNLFQWSKDHFLKCNLEAISHAFTSDEVKDEIKQQIVKAYK